eukprot:TRINITY_DN18533_c0_g1_i1.p1 TRINITY_DN18533_c0_g1~~TRINITY_DN18533_c0_g1_i1.p1  ORF type:complete len:372 (-),score=15.79 TRINITY_DN18533_c0_g1_i1:393-1508(-)
MQTPEDLSLANSVDGQQGSSTRPDVKKESGRHTHVIIWELIQENIADEAMRNSLYTYATRSYKAAMKKFDAAPQEETGFATFARAWIRDCLSRYWVSSGGKNWRLDISEGVSVFQAFLSSELTASVRARFNGGVDRDFLFEALAAIFLEWNLELGKVKTRDAKRVARIPGHSQRDASFEGRRRRTGKRREKRRKQASSRSRPRSAPNRVKKEREQTSSRSRPRSAPNRVKKEREQTSSRSRPRSATRSPRRRRKHRSSSSRPRSPSSSSTKREKQPSSSRSRPRSAPKSSIRREKHTSSSSRSRPRSTPSSSRTSSSRSRPRSTPSSPKNAGQQTNRIAAPISTPASSSTEAVGSIHHYAQLLADAFSASP